MGEIRLAEARCFAFALIFVGCDLLAELRLCGEVRRNFVLIDRRNGRERRFGAYARVAVNSSFYARVRYVLGRRRFILRDKQQVNR